jgi:hypothetical protein
LVQLPCGVVTATNVVLVGSELVKTTAVALFGPVLVSVIV